MPIPLARAEPSAILFEANCFFGVWRGPDKGVPKKSVGMPPRLNRFAAASRLC
jgi:hypothetical protein